MEVEKYFFMTFEAWGKCFADGAYAKAARAAKGGWKGWLERVA